MLYVSIIYFVVQIVVSNSYLTFSHNNEYSLNINIKKMEMNVNTTNIPWYYVLTCDCSKVFFFKLKFVIPKISKKTN
jgi:hypothetical protein